MINFKMIFKILGYLLLIETGMMVCCAAVSLYYNEGDLPCFCVSAGICLIAAMLLIWNTRHAERLLSRRDGYVIVTFSWTVISIFGSLPYLIGGYIPNVTNAFFETMSGFTTTGSSILDYIEDLPHGILFWRSFTQWIGGLGIVFFTIAILPVFGMSGTQIFAAEASGVTHDKVHSKIVVTARWIWSIYITLTCSLVVLLSLGGMNVFDSVCHALTTTSTGGFSTKQASISYYQSPYIEYLLCVYMFLAGINFTLLLMLFKGRFKKFLYDTELKFYILCVVAFTVFITIWLFCSQEMGIETAFRKSLFQVITLQTSTGFSTDDYMQWPSVLWGCLFIAMIIGGCAGSTAGGIKCIRVTILLKAIRNEFSHILHPNAVLPLRVNKRVIAPGIQSTVLAFTFLYILIVFVSVLILMALGVEVLDSIGIVISCVSNMGPGLGNYGPANTWAGLPDLAKWISSFLMLLGRLELFTVLLLFTPGLWKKS